MMSRPAMPIAEATRCARLIQREAVAHDLDPLTAVAIIHFESGFRPGAISPDGEDYGLGQIRARWLSACRADEDPVNAPSDACRAAKIALLSPENNIRRMADLITANRELCKAKVGRADLPLWLAGYEGLNSFSRQKWCSPSDRTMQVVEYRKMLVDRLAPVAPRKRQSAPAGTRSHK